MTMLPLTPDERADYQRNGPTPLELAHALRTTAEWVRSAPESERCSGHLADAADHPRYGVALDPTDSTATRWCALGRLAKELGSAQPDIYGVWSAWLPPSSYGLHSQWDEAMHIPDRAFRKNREKAFELVAQTLEHAAEFCERLIEAQNALEPVPA